MKKYILICILFLFNFDVMAWSPTPMSTSVVYGQKTFALKINNKNSNKIAAVKLKVVERTQDEYGNDILTDTKDLIVFPKQIIVPANKASAVRVLIRKPNKTKYEKSYRLVIEAVPVSKNLKEKSGVNILMRYLTSVYLEPDSEKLDNFFLQNIKLVGDAMQFEAVNLGTHHKLFTPKNITILSDKNTITIDKGNTYNILAGNAVTVSIDLTEYEAKALKSAQQVSLINACRNCKKDESYTIKMQ